MHLYLRVVGNLHGGEAAIGMPVAAWWQERRADNGTSIWLPQRRPRVSHSGAPRLPSLSMHRGILHDLKQSRFCRLNSVL